MAEIQIKIKIEKSLEISVLMLGKGVSGICTFRKLQSGSHPSDGFQISKSQSLTEFSTSWLYFRYLSRIYDFEVSEIIR